MSDSTQSHDVHALRAELFAAIRGVKSKAIDIEQAKAINDLGKTLTDLARVEVDLMRITGRAENTFIPEEPKDEPPNGITGVTRHLIRG